MFRVSGSFQGYLTLARFDLGLGLLLLGFGVSFKLSSFKDDQGLRFRV